MYSSKNGTDSFTLDKYDNNVLANCFLDNSVKPVRLINGPCGIKGVYSSYGLRLYRINDEKYKPADNAILKFDVYAQAPAQIKVELCTEANGNREFYVCTLEPAGGEEWVPFSLNAKDFKNSVGKPLSHVNGALFVTFGSKNLFCINNFIWI